MKKLLVLGVTLALVAFLAVGLSATERKGMFGADLGGVLTMPMGDFGDAFKMGWRAGANVGYFVTDQIQVGATGAYSQNKVDDTTGVGDAKFNIWQFGAFGKYHFKMQNPTITPYVRAGLGFYNGKVSVSGGSSTGETDLGINGGLGASFAVSPTASVFVEGAYHNIFAEGSSINYLAANAGLSLMFGKPTPTNTRNR
jgi:opacity protein-like surface antigen